MYIPKHYTPKELFPPEIASPVNGSFDPRNWRLYDDRILKGFDEIRENHGKMTGNEKGLTECGLRIGKFSLSQHYWGRAIDTHPKKTTCFEIRKSIIINRIKYKYITFLEIDIKGKNSGKPWLHGDCRNNGGELQLWSPTRGFVSHADYLAWGDKF